MQDLTLRVPVFQGYRLTGPALDLNGETVQFIQSVELQVPASNFLTSPQDAVNGRVGGSASSAYVVLPASRAPGAIDRYIWISHAGVGVDPGLFIPELAGWTGHEVALSTGNHTGAQVALALGEVVASIDGFLVSRSDDRVVIEGPIDALQVRSGTPWDSRGTGGRWGLGSTRVDATGFAEGSISGVAASRIVSPVGGGQVRALSVLLGANINVNDRWRVALWQGGSTTSPVGATLLWDAGRLQAGSMVADSWYRFYVPQNVLVQVGSATNLWVSIKGNVTGTFLAVYPTVSGANIRGQMVAQSFRSSTGGMDTNPANAYEAVWPGTVAGGSSFVLGVELMYEQSNYATDGSWRRYWGVHPNVFASREVEQGLNGTQLMIGQMPNLQGLEGFSQRVGLGADIVGSSPRLMQYGNASLDDPDRSDLLFDADVVTAAVVNAWNDIAMPSGETSIEYSPNQQVSLAVRSDDVTDFTLTYINNPELVDPPHLPMDFARDGLGADPLYQFNPANPNMQHSPREEPEETLLTDASDTRPGGYLLTSLRIGTRGFSIRPIG